MFETDRLIINMLDRCHRQEVFNILSNPNVICNLNMDKINTLEDVDKLIDDYYKYYDKHEKFPFEIIDKETGKFVGVFLIKLDLYDEDCFEYTIYLSEDFWGKGISTEITPIMNKYAFEVIGTGNVRGFIMEHNLGSRKVLEKCKFKLEKIFNVPGIDEKIYSYLMTKEDYLNMR